MKTSDKIIEYLQKHGQVTGNELVDYLGITDRAVRKQLKTLLDSGKLAKAGTPPRVYYSVALGPPAPRPPVMLGIDPKTIQLIDKEFLYVTPRGTMQTGMGGFAYWCAERKLDPAKTADRYAKIFAKYRQYKKADLIDGIYKMKTTFDEVALDKVFYIDFYSIEIFGKTKLGQLLLFAKQSQNRQLMNELTDTVKPTILHVIKKYHIDGVGFIPPTVKRELQLMKQVQNRLNLNVRTVDIYKIKTPVAVPQKTLNKLEDRIINARETISVDSTGSYNNILLIDDAVGSGSTLNETARKVRQKSICKGRIIGLAITGSFKGFEVISEV